MKCKRLAANAVLVRSERTMVSSDTAIQMLALSLTILSGILAKEQATVYHCLRFYIFWCKYSPADVVLWRWHTLEINT